MIQNIEQILNFRYSPFRYLNRRWKNEYPNNMSEAYLNRHLKNYPPIYKKFKLTCEVMFARGEVDMGLGYNIFNSKSDLVLCKPKALTSHINTIKKLIESFDINNSILVCCGRDTALSENISNLTLLRPFFKKIYYEAKDIECDWVTTIPMGINFINMLRCGGDEILHHINKPKNKTKLISSAFGSRWPKLTDTIEDRKLLKAFTQSSQFMDNMFCHPLDYFEKLSDYKFFACPLGNGIQTPKICESILCETVPVVTNHITYRELRDIYDLPLLIVDKWEDLTEDFLNEAYDSKYKHINWQKEKAKFLVENFKNLLK